MTKSEITPGVTVRLGALTIVLRGCQKKQGPAKQAGKKVDEATRNVGREIEKAGNKIQDAGQRDKQVRPRKKEY